MVQTSEVVVLPSTQGRTQPEQGPILPIHRDQPSGWDTDLRAIAEAAALNEPTQRTIERRPQETTTNAPPANKLVLKLSDLTDKNVYVLAEKVEISLVENEDTSEEPSFSDFMDLITSLTSLASALSTLLAAGLAYKEKKKSKPSDEDSDADSDEEPLIQININNGGISNFGFKVPAALALDILSQAGMLPAEASSDAIDKPQEKTVVLDPELATAFPTPEAINEALRAALKFAELIKPTEAAK